MSAVDTIATIGELLSWSGVILGVPLLAAALLLRARDRRRPEHSDAQRVCALLAVIMLGTAAAGFLVSLAPLLE